MPGIYGGTAQFKDIYVGVNKVAEIYVGTTKVWPNVNTLYSDPSPADNLADWNLLRATKSQLAWGIRVQSDNNQLSWYGQIDFTPVVGKLVTVKCNVNQLGLGNSGQPVKFAVVRGGTFITDVDTIVGDNVITFTPTQAVAHQMRFGQFVSGDTRNAYVTVNSVLITQEA